MKFAGHSGGGVIVQSPSARRVLVEIRPEQRAEEGQQRSPSARRVLVEICGAWIGKFAQFVTLREEGVG